MASAQQISRKTLVGAFVIGVHVLLGLGLAIATAVNYVRKQDPTVLANLLKHEEELDKKAPPPPPPDFHPPPVQAPPMDLPIVEGPPPPAAVVTKHEEPKPVEKPAAPPPITQAHVAKGVNLGELCSASYPSASRRLSEEGSVTLLVFIAPNGKVTETKIESSSGFQRLDEAAEKCMRSYGKFDPQKVGNEAVGSWQRIKWTWRLTS